MIRDMTTFARQSEPTAVLDAALGTLADVLAGAEANLEHYCGYCYAEADAVALAGPLDRVPEDLLVAAAAEVSDHWGDFANLYRKLTPRIMALLVHDDLHIDPEQIADRLADAGCWETWAADERDAMLAVCRAWWEVTLTAYPRRPEAREVFGFLATTPVPLTEWLEIWNSQPSGPADLHALDVCEWWASAMLGGSDLMLGWWGRINVTADIKRWILEDARARIDRVTADPYLIEVLARLESGD